MNTDQDRLDAVIDHQWTIRRTTAALSNSTIFSVYKDGRQLPHTLSAAPRRSIDLAMSVDTCLTCGKVVSIEADEAVITPVKK